MQEIEFGKILKKIRLDMQLSQEEMAKKLNTTKQVLSRYETNQRIPKISTVAEYANKLNLPIEIFWGNHTIEKKFPAASAEDNNKYKSITDNLDKLNESGVEAADDYIEYLTKQDKYKKHHEPEHMEKEA